MKNILLTVMLLFSVIARGQDNKNAFEEAFEDMFQYEEPVWIPEDTPPDPPVPLDGGLVALLAAGGAVAYKKYQSTKLITARGNSHHKLKPSQVQRHPFL